MPNSIQGLQVSKTLFQTKFEEFQKNLSEIKGRDSHGYDKLIKMLRQEDFDLQHNIIK